MNRSGRLVVLSGFAGTGKGTVVKKLISKYPDQYVLSVSATTRDARPGEEEGRDYFFKTHEEFEEMISQGELLEYARYVDNFYGTPKSYVEEQMGCGKNVLLEIEIQGGMQVREMFPDTLLLFLIPPTAGDLVSRLRGRGTETDSQIRARLSRAVEEAKSSEAYDYLIINDDLDRCVETTHQIIQNDRWRMPYCSEDLNVIRQDLIEYLKGESL